MTSQSPVSLVARTGDGVLLALDYFPGRGRTCPPILFIHGYGQNRLTWHHPLLSLPARTAQLGHPSYFLDLRGHGRSREMNPVMPSGYPDFIDQDIPAAVDFIREHSGQDKVLLLGHSMGGLTAAIAAARRPEHILGVAAMASPCRNFGRSPTFGLLSYKIYGTLAAKIRMSAHGRTLAPRLPGVRLDLLGRIEEPLDNRILPKLPEPLRNLGERMFFPVRPWIKGSLPEGMDGDRMLMGFDWASGGVTAETLTLAYQGHLPGEQDQDLVEHLKTLTLPVLLISSPQDQMVPTEAALTAADFPLCEVAEHVVSGFGHGDIVLGKEAPARTWSLLEAWLARRTA